MNLYPMETQKLEQPNARIYNQIIISPGGLTIIFAAEIFNLNSLENLFKHPKSPCQRRNDGVQEFGNRL